MSQLTIYFITGVMVGMPAGVLAILVCKLVKEIDCEIKDRRERYRVPGP